MIMNSFESNFKFNFNDCTLEELIALHLECDKDFYPPLTSRVNIESYCSKLLENAVIVTCRDGGELVGIIAIYCNDIRTKSAFISSICISPKYRGKRLSNQLMGLAIEKAKDSGMLSIKLEVGINNTRAISLYEKFGFITVEINDESQLMQMTFK